MAGLEGAGKKQQRKVWLGWAGKGETNKETNCRLMLQELQVQLRRKMAGGGEDLQWKKFPTELLQVLNYPNIAHCA